MHNLRISSFFAVFGLSFTLIASAVHAAAPEELRENPGRLAALKKEGPNASDARVRAALGLTSDETLEVVRTYPDGRGGSVTRYRQKFQGVPVWGEQIIISKDRTGNIINLHGRLVAGLAREVRQTKPAFTEKNALNTLQERVRSRRLGEEQIYKNQKSELVIYLDQDIPRLSYAVSFFADSKVSGQPTRPNFIIDAVSGEIIAEFEGLTHVCNTGCDLINETSLSGATGTWKYYAVNVPSDVVANSQLQITVSGGTGDADLYVRKGTTNPTTGIYDCGSLSSSNNEQCIQVATAGDQWSVGLYSYANFSGVSISIKVKTITPALAIGPGGNAKIGSYGYGAYGSGTQYGSLSVSQ